MAASKKADSGFSDFEREAIKNRAKELLAESKATNKKEAGLTQVKTAIADLKESDRKMAQKLHDMIMEIAPEIWPRTWYGMPGYAKGFDQPIICFFQGSDKFKTRYSTLGFNNEAKLDDGDMWPTAYGIMKMTPEVEKKVREIIKKALG